MPAELQPQARPSHAAADEIRRLLRTVPAPLALLEALFAYLPVGLQIYSADGRCLLVNDAFRKLFGSAPPPEYNVLEDEIAAQQGVLPLIRRAFQGESIQTPVIWYDPRDLTQVKVTEGRRVAIETSFVPLFDACEKVSHVAVVFTEVTRELESRLQAETAQRTAEADRDRQRLMAEATAALSASLDYEATVAEVVRLLVPRLADTAGIFHLESDGTIRQLALCHVDPAKEALLWELHQLVPLHIDQDRLLPRAMRLGQPQMAADIPPEVRKDWTRLPRAEQIVADLGLRSYMAVPLHARGRVIGALAMSSADSGRRLTPDDLSLAQDLANRMAVALDNARLYREAQDASRLKDDFLAVVSHELRTPLQAILGWARLLRTRQLDDDKRTRALETIERNSLAQAQLIEDLLDISRIVSGRLRLDMSAVDPAQVVDMALESIRPGADAKGVLLQKIVDPDAGPVMGDPDRLQQVVWNLLSNAVKFTPSGGHVAAHVRRRGSGVEIAVTDTGKGIATEFLPHVFERFRQADSSSIRQHGGLGLGLAIVRHLVESHGGTVQAASAGEGQGATFLVHLPGAHPRTPRRSAARTEAPNPDGEEPRRLDGVRVLVVDDAADARELMTVALEHAGAAVTAVGSAADALAALESPGIDVVVSDIEMPDLNGYGLIRELRARPAEASGRVPALAITAYARLEDRTRALAAGFSAHVAKPVQPAELVLMVASLAGRFGKS